MHPCALWFLHAALCMGCGFSLPVGKDIPTCLFASFPQASLKLPLLLSPSGALIPFLMRSLTVVPAAKD